MAKPPKELERLWYAKLKESGFEDIEDTELPGRPLKAWHSRKFITPESVRQQARQAPVQDMNEHLLNHNLFLDICRMVASDGRVKATKFVVARVWTLHCEGKSTREIATQVHLTQSTTDRLIRRMTKWTTLL